MTHLYILVSFKTDKNLQYKTQKQETINGALTSYDIRGSRETEFNHCPSP